MSLVTLFREQIRKVNTTQSASINVHSYKVLMYIQKLHHFCNTFSPDDGPNLGRKYLGYYYLWKVYQPITVEYQYSNRKD